MSDQILENQQITLLELLDRLLDKGVMAKGEILLSVADVDLVYLNLGLLLSSVKTVECAAGRDDNQKVRFASPPPAAQGEVPNKFYRESEDKNEETITSSGESSQKSDGNEDGVRSLPTVSTSEPGQVHKSRSNIDPKNVEKGLAKLVLTLVDLIRKLMEKQTIRKIENEQLNDEEIEKVGTAFMLLDKRMEEIKKTFGLKDEDLNLNLGPLGDLL